MNEIDLSEVNNKYKIYILFVTEYNRILELGE